MNEIIMDRTRCLVDSMPEHVIDNLTNYSRAVRLRALNTIIKSLDEKEEDDNQVIQTIPLYLVSMGDFDAAISFLSTIISCNYPVAVEVINEVYRSTTLEMQDPEVIGDFEFMTEINRKINLLMSTAKKKEGYSENSKFLITLGKDYERKGDFYKAISIYDTLISNGDEIGYLYSALAYKELGKTEFAIILLENAYSIYGDKIFLENIIIIYNQLGNINNAKQAYLRLKSTVYNENGNTKENVVLPFIMYSFIIEDDSDLKNFEVLMANYLLENELPVLEPLLKLSLVANDYIETNLDDIRSKIDRFNNIGVNNLSKEDRVVYDELVLRKLYLMQVHISILKEDKYLGEHLSDLDILAFSREDEKFNLLGGYFDDNISLLVKGNLNTKKEKDLEEPEHSEFDTFENLSMYVATLSMIFFHGKNYRVMSQKLFPFLEKCYNEIGDIDENEIPYSLKVLKDETDYIDTFSPLLQNTYNEFINKIDVKYGKFIRVTLQNTARDSIDIKEEDYPEVLLENKELALLFFAEKLISRNFPNMDTKDFGDFIKKYNLGGLAKDEILLFTYLIYDSSFDLTIDLVINNEYLLNSIFSIYYLLESLVNIPNNSELRKTLKDLNKFFKETYETRGFFDYIRRFMVKSFKKEDLSELEKSYILLCAGNMAILQKKGPETIIESFIASEELGSNEATIQLGNIFEDNGYFDQSIMKFQEAYTLDPNINNLSKLISALFNKGDLKTAFKFIQSGLDARYTMDLYLYTYYFLKGNFVEALSSFIGVLNKNIPILDIPEGTLDLFMEKCHTIKTMDSEINFDSLKLKFMSSYIVSKIDLMYEYGNKSENICYHGVTAFSIFHNVHLNILPRFLNETLFPIYGTDSDISDELGIEVDDMEKALIILDFYANHIYKSLLRLSGEIKSIEELNSLHDLLNNYINAFVVFISQLPGTEEIVNEWRKKIYFKPEQGIDIMDEEIHGGTMLN
ncbi:MAG: hypothetical protein PHV23_01540 [Candidatus Gracilibacteria bacterium]|nr:hypothetical protein [Candidatus Gracilibacteria bacterium]